MQLKYFFTNTSKNPVNNSRPVSEKRQHRNIISFRTSNEIIQPQRQAVRQQFEIIRNGICQSVAIESIPLQVGKKLRNADTK